MHDSDRLQRTMFVCGILSSILYVVTDILGGIMCGNYDFTSQYVSELSAIGSPSRPFVVSLYIVYNFLVMAFIAGVWQGSIGKRNLQMLSCLLCGYVLGGLVGLFFPMDPSELGTAFTNAMHQTLAGVTVLFILLSLAVGAYTQRKRFGFYSIGTILIYLALGSLPFLGVAQVEEGLSTPWLGLVERIMVYGYMLWIGILSALLLRRERYLNS
ncbi:MAG: DUF998 domain-containing protein [Promethearchaeota archaeon]